ncbi:MAG: FAD-binding oxidoreductase [Candidatus Thermoplasmatota archaeon]|nr:FAD-binding oxidoreductase [Candidatus Thermoplasmatota archaeon]
MKHEVVGELEKILGKERVSTEIADLYVYGFDASIHHVTPDAVVRPANAQQVSEIVKLANRTETPIVPRGAGTAMCGHTVPVKGGIIVDMTQMNKIKELRVEDLYCVVEPGVIYDKLNAELSKRGFWFPATPGSGEACTIGGMVATNASGMRAIKYGATRDYVLGLEVVLPTGEIIHTGTRTLKNSSGYQLDRLMVGSEGTLGIITEITMRFTMKPKASGMTVAAFKSLKDAGQCVSNIIAKPLLPSAIELMDSVCIKAINKCMNIGLPDCEALCMIEVDGHPVAVEEEMVTVEEICKSTGAVSTEKSRDKKKIDEWTQARKAIMPSLSRYGEKFVSVALADDMSVPISRIPEAVVAFQKIAEENGVVVGTYGHSADGNLHTKMLVEPYSRESWKAGEKAVGMIYDKVLELGGTVTGEHGVAITKAPYMQKERADSLGAMRAIKHALDPKNIMNPGKIFDWEGSIIYELRYPAFLEPSCSSTPCNQCDNEH